MSILLKPKALEYAQLLQGAGFEVYVPNPDRLINAATSPGGNGWFHYSRIVAGQRCYGTVYVEPEYGLGAFHKPDHTMPVKPTREYGSAIIVASRSNGKNRPADPLTVEAARYTAMPQNAAAFMPKSFHNARPWGVPKPDQDPAEAIYVPVEVAAGIEVLS